jgi:Flp pilus assembly protein TadD
MVLRKQGHFREALRAFEMATAWMGEKGKNKIYHSIGLTTIAETLCFVGEYDRSAQVAEKAIAVAADVGHDPYMAFARIGLGKTWFMQGRREEAMELVRGATDLAARHSAEWEVASGECALGEMLFEMGRRDMARTSLQHVVRIARDAAYDEFLIRAFGYLSAIQLLEDDVAFGRSRLRELIDRSADTYISVVLKRLLGLCQIEKPADNSDRDAGVQLLEEAMSVARRMSFKSEMDRIRTILANV